MLRRDINDCTQVTKFGKHNKIEALDVRLVPKDQIRTARLRECRNNVKYLFIIDMLGNSVFAGMDSRTMITFDLKLPGFQTVIHKSAVSLCVFLLLSALKMTEKN